MTTIDAPVSVELFHWNPLKPVLASRIGRRIPLRKRLNNFGDLLGPIVARLMLEKLGQPSAEHPPYDRRLLTVGSVLHFARNGDAIWGTGRNGKVSESKHDFSRLDVRATRGPLTQAFLETRGIESPSVFGDPALLLPLLRPEIQRWAETKERRVTVVPNLNDLRDYKAAPDVLDPRRPVDDCIRTIATSEFVVASSLHGVIVAESLGIPARLIVSGAESKFKYEDYYRGTGRSMPEPAPDWRTALKEGPTRAAEKIKWDPSALMDAFPLDIWTR